MPQRSREQVVKDTKNRFEAENNIPGAATPLPVNQFTIPSKTSKFTPRTSTPSDILALQRTIGNKAVCKLLNEKKASPTANRPLTTSESSKSQLTDTRTLSARITPATSATVQRLVGTKLMVGDPVVIIKYGEGVIAKVSTAYLNGKYFIKTAPFDTFNDFDGTYSLNELNYHPNFDYKGRNTTENSNTPQTEQVEEINPQQLEKLGLDDGFEAGYSDGSHSHTKFYSYESGQDQRYNNGYYIRSYKRGYEEGFVRGSKEPDIKDKEEYYAQQKKELEKDAKFLQTGKRPVAKTEEEKAQRKKDAKSYFEGFVAQGGINGRTTSEIAQFLLAIKDHFGLTNVSIEVADDVMDVGFFASPPDYSHLNLVKYGPDPTKEADHPASAFTATKPKLESVERDAKKETPLGAIMSQLGLKINEVSLLVKGNLEKADRPKRVRALVVGPRRIKGGRVNDSITAAVAHLGDHENTILNSDTNTWTDFYDGGHLIGDQLMPSNGPDTFVEWNLAPMEQVLNQQSYLNFVEKVIAAGAVDKAVKKSNTVPISIVVSVYYPDDEYSVTEEQLAKHGIIPNDGSIPITGHMQYPGGKPKSGKNRTIKIPSRVPYKWVLEAKLDQAAYSFGTKDSKPSKTSKPGNIAHSYYDWDLKTFGAKEIPQSERHHWMLKGSNKDSTTNSIKTAANQKQMSFEAYQYYPARK